MPQAKPLRATPVASGLMAAGLVVLAASSSWAAGPVEPGRAWIAFDVGEARLPAGSPGLTDAGTHWMIDFSAGLAVSHRVLLGAELGSWLIKPDWPSQNTAAGIGTIFVTARVYPIKKSAFHLRLGGGLMLGWEDTPPGSNIQRLGWEAGVGYDLRFADRHHLTPFIMFCRGHVGRGGVNLNVVTFGAGYTYR